MQFQVPQFIESEDKIVGPLSLRQVAFLGAAGVISFFLYFTVSTTAWVFITIFVGGFGVALAFIKVNGRPLNKIVKSAMGFYWKSQTYVWRPDRPNLPKTTSSMPKRARGFSVEKIMQGLALKRAWRAMQAPKESKYQNTIPAPHSKYLIYTKPTGERKAAKRVDYR